VRRRRRCLRKSPPKQAHQPSRHLTMFQFVRGWRSGAIAPGFAPLGGFASLSALTGSERRKPGAHRRS
jgi:hypothetical protein